MSEEEKDTWGLLNKMIDVPAHRAQTPLVYSDIGQLTSIDPYEITWFGGNKDRISLRTAPAGFAALELGQWFDAIIKYDYEKRRICELLHVRACDPMEPMSDEAAREFFDSLPTTSELPTTQWDDL